MYRLLICCTNVFIFINWFDRYDFRAGFWGVMGGPCLGIIFVSCTTLEHTIGKMLYGMINVNDLVLCCSHI